jgi:hypothetical protein
MNKFTRLLAVTGVTGALALGATGVAAADQGTATQKSPDTAAAIAKSPSSSPDRMANHDHGKSKDHNGKGKDHSGSKDHNGKGKDHGKSKDHDSKR